MYKDIDRIKELNELKNSVALSKRTSSLELEEILFEPLKVLNHGFIRVIDYMGNDSAITQAARVSYGKGTKTLQNDKALINYLMRHSHTSPFEMCEIKFHIKAPIFIARQWLRHRTANVNEYSGRYSLMPQEYYIPESNQIMEQSIDNKQGKEKILEKDLNDKTLEYIKNSSENSFKAYENLLNLNVDAEKKIGAKDSQEINKIGLTRELARIVLPLNVYTEFYWKIDLHNLLHFVLLRIKPNAQYEIRVYAEVMLDIIKKWVPLVYSAFVNYKLKSVTLSKEGKKAIKDIIKFGKVNKNNYKLSKREWLEIEEMFDLFNFLE